MDEELSIQQAAALTELSAHTLRYYERVGLIEPVSRASSGHRRYFRRDIDWIEFLTRLRATGMPIREMQQFAELRRQGDCTFPQRRKLLEKHQQRIREQINMLSRNSRVLEQKIQHYKELEDQHETD